MKKIVVCVLLALAFLLSSLSASAGDVHEAFIRSESALIFFGKVTAYQSNKESSHISVSPLAVVKGSIAEDTTLSFDNPSFCGDFRPKNGRIYLIGYLDENNTYIFEVTAYDTQTLQIKHAKGVWEAFEQYLNSGKYGTAKLEGIAPNAESKTALAIYCTLGGVVCILLFSVINICNKRKQRFNT